MKRPPVKRTGQRPYNSANRRAAAEQTRDAIRRAAREAFIEQGYAATTMADVARRAGVALDTVYASFGQKHALFRLLVETAISGTSQAVPAEERDYVRAIRAEPVAKRKLVLYAQALRKIQERLAPLIRVLKMAAPADVALMELWQGIARRRAANMRLFAADLAATGALRRDVSIDEAADVLWATNAPEFYLLLVEERGWSPERFEAWIAAAWTRWLLR